MYKFTNDGVVTYTVTILVTILGTNYKDVLIQINVYYMFTLTITL